MVLVDRVFFYWQFSAVQIKGLNSHYGLLSYLCKEQGCSMITKLQALSSRSNTNNILMNINARPTLVGFICGNILTQFSLEHQHHAPSLSITAVFLSIIKLAFIFRDINTVTQCNNIENKPEENKCLEKAE